MVTSSTKQQQQKSSTTSTNPLLDQQQQFLSSLSTNDRTNFFSNNSVQVDRRAQVWMDQADIGSELVNKYSWATPDERAVSILQHFGPIVEIGCGANAYWCRVMQDAGIDVIGYDTQPEKGGKIQSKKKKKKQQDSSPFSITTGGPEVLSTDVVDENRTLFLCYPDEDPQAEGGSISMAASCLEHFRGTHVIHVGELYDSLISVEPWGRSSSPEFQTRLNSEYHCLLRAELPNWLHVRDTITVWKRSETCSIVFAADDDDDDEEEEVEYRHIPVEERLPTDVAAPCLAHLLTTTTNKKEDEGHNKSNDTNNSKRKNQQLLTDELQQLTDELQHDDNDDDSQEESLNTTPANAPANQTHGKKKKKRKKSKKTENESSSEYQCPW